MTGAWLLRLYPRAWRARYEDEFRALLEQRPLSLQSILDVALGAIDAHQHLDLRLGRAQSPLAVVRATVLTVLGLAACIVAAWHFGALVDDGPYLCNMAAGHPGPLLDPDLGNPLSVTTDILAAGALGATLAVLAGGAPLAFMAWRSAPHGRRWLLGPSLAAAALLLPPAVNLLAYVLTGGAVSTTAMFTPDTRAGVVYTLWTIAVASAGTAAGVRALATAVLDAERVRFAFLPSVAATVGLVLMTGAVTAWGILAPLRAAHAAIPTWGCMVALMAAASALAVRAVVRAGPVWAAAR